MFKMTVNRSALLLFCLTSFNVDKYENEVVEFISPVKIHNLQD